jgi:hypothetical protein
MVRKLETFWLLLLHSSFGSRCSYPQLSRPWCRSYWDCRQSSSTQIEANVPLALGSCVLNLLAILVEILGVPVLRFMLNLRSLNSPCNDDIFAASAVLIWRLAPTEMS